MKSRGIVLILLLGVLAHSCVEPYPLSSTESDNRLVVEGLITNEDKPQQIKLSRTSSLNEEVFIGETGADVEVQTASGQKISFSEIEDGIYESPSFAGIIGEKYTLYITTSDEHEYKSLPVTLKNVPSIGKIYAEFVTAPDRGIKISIDTEDQQNNTHYYRWNYIETYEIQTPFPSNYAILPGATEPTWRYDRVDDCWANDTLRSVLIKSTVGQSQDKVIAQQLRFIAEDSYIFRVKYSILVQQFAMSEEAYNYWDNTRILNETQGTLADVQPGAINSNVTSVTDPSETVLGYFDASALSEQRVFFDYRDFTKAGYVRPTYMCGCNELSPTLVHQDDIYQYMLTHSEDEAIWDVIGSTPNVYFELMPRSCCDCSNMGTTVKPSFWQ